MIHVNLLLECCAKIIKHVKVISEELKVKESVKYTTHMLKSLFIQVNIPINTYIIRYAGIYEDKKSDNGNTYVVIITYEVRVGKIDKKKGLIKL